MSVDSRQIECTAAAWLASRDAGHWGAHEHAAFAAWLEQDVAHRVAFLRLNATWNEAARLATLGAGDDNDGIPARGEWAQSLFFEASTSHAGRVVVADAAPRQLARRRRGPMFAGVAATLLLAIMFAAGFVWHSTQTVNRGAWQTAVGAQQVVHLADGSTATLSSDTNLRTALSQHERKLTLLHGEAFFDVAPDRNRPFVVHVNGHRVVAVGTRFSVRRDGGDKLRVVVTRGLVQLQSGDDSSRVVEDLPIGTIATMEGDRLAVRHVTLEQAREYLSWRRGYLVFHDTPLLAAVAEFNRYNRSKILIADPSLDNLRIGGNFRVDNGAAFVRLLEQVLPVRAHKQGPYLTLSRRDVATASD